MKKFTFDLFKNRIKLKSKKIYLIRHGQTDYNLKGIVQGSGIDASINENGRKQADLFYNAYQHIAFDKVYTSKLQRSKQSVIKFIDKGIPHIELDGLNEINWGNREGKLITIAEDRYYKHVLQEWRNGNTSLRIEGGESPEDVFEKQQIALSEIINNEDDTAILICMHGRAMRILLCLLLKYPLFRMDEFEHTNLCLYLLSYENGVFQLEKSNEIEHLQ